MDKLSVKTPENRAMWEHIAHEREKNDADVFQQTPSGPTTRSRAAAAGTGRGGPRRDGS